MFSETEGLGYFKKIRAVERRFLRFYMNWKPFKMLFKKKIHLTCCSQLLFDSDTQEIESCYVLLQQNTVTLSLCCFQIPISPLLYSLFLNLGKSYWVSQTFTFSRRSLLYYLSPLIFPQQPATDNKNLNLLSENLTFRISKEVLGPRIAGLPLPSDPLVRHPHCTAAVLLQ